MEKKILQRIAILEKELQDTLGTKNKLIATLNRLENSVQNHIGAIKALKSLIETTVPEKKNEDK